MNPLLRLILYSLFLFLTAQNMQAQLTVSGTVYDSSKTNYVENVRVVSTGGIFAITDSLGRYNIRASENDSLIFFYGNKPTIKFAVHAIADLSHFDISLRININSKYRVLKEVTLFSKSYRQDSLQNREDYAAIFNYQKPGLQSGISPTGVAGADLDELVNVFRFRRNKRIKAFQQRLELQEQDKYVNYRFNKITVKRITGLQGSMLDTFLIWYRPPYEFARNSDELVFNQYILNAFYQYRKLRPYP